MGKKDDFYQELRFFELIRWSSELYSYYRIKLMDLYETITGKSFSGSLKEKLPEALLKSHLSKEELQEIIFDKFSVSGGFKAFLRPWFTFLDQFDRAEPQYSNTTWEWFIYHFVNTFCISGVSSMKIERYLEDINLADLASVLSKPLKKALLVAIMSEEMRSTYGRELAEERCLIHTRLRRLSWSAKKKEEKLKKELILDKPISGKDGVTLGEGLGEEDGSFSRVELKADLSDVLDKLDVYYETSFRKDRAENYKRIARYRLIFPENTTREIAKDLRLSERTVKTWRSEMKKVPFD